MNFCKKTYIAAAVGSVACSALKITRLNNSHTSLNKRQLLKKCDKDKVSNGKRQMTFDKLPNEISHSPVS